MVHAPASRSSASAAFVACVLRAMGKEHEIAAPLSAPIRPARVIPDPYGHVAYSGCSHAQFDDIASWLTERLGEPKREDNTMQGEWMGCTITYPNGVSMAFNTFRDSGFSLAIPKAAVAPLVAHVQQAQQEQAQNETKVAR